DEREVSCSEQPHELWIAGAAVLDECGQEQRACVVIEAIPVGVARYAEVAMLEDPGLIGQQAQMFEVGLGQRGRGARNHRIATGAPLLVALLGRTLEALEICARD